MSAVNLHTAKQQLSELVELAMSGQDVLIGRHGRPEVRLTPVEPARSRVRFGVLKGRLRIAPDFDAPLSPDELAAFDGPVDRS